MTKIASLGVTESIRVDSRRVQDIVNELGEVAAEGVIQVALEQMAVVIDELQQAVETGNSGQISSQAERLSRLAWQVGLVSLAAVSVDVADCARRQEIVALTATMARTVRVANRSLTEVWDGIAGK